MKRRMLIIGLSALVMLAASCKKNNDSDVRFKATIEDNGSKTHLYEGNKLAWNANDQIRVFGSGGSYGDYTAANIQDASNSKQAEFTGADINSNDYYRAFYPVTTAPSLSGETFTFTMPASQTYCSDGTFANTLNPMLAKDKANTGSTTTLHFTNLFGVLKIYVEKSNVAATKAVLTVPDGAPALTGTFTANCDNLTVTGPAATEANRKLTLDLGGSLPLAGKYFYFVLPPGALAQGFTIAFYDHVDDGDAVLKKSTVTTGYNLLGNHIVGATMDVELETIGIMTSSTQVIEFAPGNLQYQASSGNWRFAEHAWDFIDGVEIVWGNGVGAWQVQFNGTPTGNNTPLAGVNIYGTNNQLLSFSEVRDTQTAWIDLFGWGATGRVQNTMVYGPCIPFSTNEDWVDTQYQPWQCFNNQHAGRDYSIGYGPFGTGTTLTGDWEWGTNDMKYYNGDDAGDNWRTLSKEEWDYLINNTSKFGYAEFTDHPFVDQSGQSRQRCLSGFVFLPIGFIDPKCGADGKAFVHAPAGYVGYNQYRDNQYTEDTWPLMEAAGAAFIPCAGTRGEYGVTNAASGLHGGMVCQYWSSTADPDNPKKAFVFRNENGSETAGAEARTQDSDRSAGCSVRLARNVKTIDPVE